MKLQFILILKKRIFFKALGIFSVFLGLILTFFCLSPALAIFPATPFAPGETSNPTCSPGDVNCTVFAPLPTTLSSSTAIIMGTSSLRFAFDPSNFTFFNVASNGVLTISSTNNDGLIFAKVIGTSITSTNAFFNNLAAAVFNPTSINTGSITSTNIFLLAGCLYLVMFQIYLVQA